MHSSHAIKPMLNRPARLTGICAIAYGATMIFPIKHIRQEIFGVNQTVFAKIAGVTQATVSRWERGEFDPRGDELAAIRQAAIERGLPWNDKWFFEAPQQWMQSA